MKEKSSTVLAEPVSGAGGPSVPSVDSRSVLERSTLVLRWSREQSCWSPVEVASVWEDSEDRRLLEGCFRADAALLSGDGDSGATLGGEKAGRGQAACFRVRPIQCRRRRKKTGAWAALHTPRNETGPPLGECFGGTARCHSCAPTTPGGVWNGRINLRKLNSCLANDEGTEEQRCEVASPTGGIDLESRSSTFLSFWNFFPRQYAQVPLG